MKACKDESDKYCPPSASARTDWYLHGGNVHFARDISSFATYTALKDKFARTPNSSFPPKSMVGVGRVFVPVLDQSGRTVRLRLENVMHIPSLPCNGISRSAEFHAPWALRTYQNDWCDTLLAAAEQSDNTWNNGHDEFFLLRRATEGHVGCSERKTRDPYDSLAMSVDQQTKETCKTALERGYEQPSKACHDWYLHSGNVNFARDISAFTIYVPLIHKYVSSTTGWSIGAVAGIGTCSVPVKPNRDARSTPEDWEIRYVLHIPDAPCNGISQVRLREHPFEIDYGHGRGGTWTTSKKTGPHSQIRPVAYGTRESYLRLERADGLVGSSVRDDPRRTFKIATSMDERELRECRESFDFLSGERPVMIGCCD